jgi:hypothetical protein
MLRLFLDTARMFFVYFGETIAVKDEEGDWSRDLVEQRAGYGESRRNGTAA